MKIKGEMTTRSQESLRVNWIGSQCPNTLCVTVTCKMVSFYANGLKPDRLSILGFVFPNFVYPPDAAILVPKLNFLILFFDYLILRCLLNM